MLTTAAAIQAVGESAVRWRLSTGRWQRPCRGVVITHSGPVSDDEELWVAVHAAGPRAVLGGLTAARLGGLSGFTGRAIHVLVPASCQVRVALPRLVAHRSRALTTADVHPLRQPPRTRIARSLLDAAAWSRTDDGARALLAAGVQQRLTRPDQIAGLLGRFPTIRRHALIASTLADISGGAQALSELDFCRLTRRYRLPEPDRQAVRRDEAGRRRWLDAYWDQACLVVEVDGLWHMEAAAWWADMYRENDLTLGGLRVLRFPAFAVRDHPSAVAGQLRRALMGAAPAGHVGQVTGPDIG